MARWLYTFAGISSWAAAVSGELEQLSAEDITHELHNLLRNNNREIVCFSQFLDGWGSVHSLMAEDLRVKGFFKINWVSALNDHNVVLDKSRDDFPDTRQAMDTLYALYANREDATGRYAIDFLRHSQNLWQFVVAVPCMAILTAVCLGPSLDDAEFQLPGW